MGGVRTLSTPGQRTGCSLVVDLVDLKHNPWGKNQGVSIINRRFMVRECYGGYRRFKQR